MVDKELIAEFKQNRREPDEATRLRHREDLLLRTGERLYGREVTYTTYAQSYRAWYDENAEELDGFLDVEADRLEPVLDYILTKCEDLPSSERIYYLEFLHRNNYMAAFEAYFPAVADEFFVEQFIRDSLLMYSLELRKKELMVSLTPKQKGDI